MVYQEVGVEVQKIVKQEIEVSFPFLDTHSFSVPVTYLLRSHTAVV